MKIRLYNNRYLQFFVEAGEQISVELSTDELTPTVSLDLQDVIGIEGAQGDTGVQGPAGKSAKEILIDANVLAVDATDADFFEVLKGEVGPAGTSVVDVAVASTQNTTVERYDCVDGICKIREEGSSVIGATKTTLEFDMSNGTKKNVSFISEGGAYVSMSMTDYVAFFGGTSIPDNSGILTYTGGSATIYAVPVAYLESLREIQQS